MRISILCVALMVFAGGSLSAQDRRQVPRFETFGAPASVDDAEAVTALLGEFRDAWGAQDVDRLIAVHAEDVEWINAYARIFRGRDALRTFLEEQLFPQWDSSVSMGEAEGMTPISLRFLGDGGAVAHWYTDGERGAEVAGGDGPRRTHITIVMEKRQDSGWQIVHEAIFDAR